MDNRILQSLLAPFRGNNRPPLFIISPICGHPFLFAIFAADPCCHFCATCCGGRCNFVDAGCQLGPSPASRLALAQQPFTRRKSLRTTAIRRGSLCKGRTHHRASRHGLGDRGSSQHSAARIGRERRSGELRPDPGCGGRIRQSAGEPRNQRLHRPSFDSESGQLSGDF